METIASSRGEAVASCLQEFSQEADFPAFSEHIQRVMEAIEDQDSSVRSLTNLILRDYSLTLRLLRTANSPVYNHSARQILSVTHAVVMLGGDTVREIACGLMVFEHFQKRTANVRELMMLSLLTAGHVRSIAERVHLPQVEEAYLCGMVRNIGELLIAYYRPRLYTEILRQVRESTPAAAACTNVLQFTFEDLGQAAVRHWGMPERAALCQRPFRVPGRNSGAWDTPETKLLAAVSLGHQMTNAVYRQEPATQQVSLKLQIQDHSPMLPLSSEDVREILENSITSARDAFAAMKVRIDDLRLRAQTKTALEALDDAATDSLSKDDVLERLTAEARAMLESGAGLNSVILAVLEALFRGGGFERVLFAFVNAEGTRMQARAGLGDDIESLLARFNFPFSLRAGPVVPALLRKTDTVVSARNEPENDLLQAFGVRWLAIYPVVVDSRVVGCLYLENAKPRADLSTGQLVLMEQLRNILVSAIQRVRRGLG